MKKEEIILIIFIIVLLSISACFASENQLAVNIASKHLSDVSQANKEYYGVDEFNESNFGFGVELFKHDKYYLLGTYKNSYNLQSFYVGIGKTFFVNKYLQCGGDIYVSSNYDGMAKVVSGYIKLMYEHRGIKVSFIPGKTLGGFDSDIFTLQLVAELR